MLFKTEEQSICLKHDFNGWIYITLNIFYFLIVYTFTYVFFL